MKHSLGGLGAVFCLILLLACPALALTGARNGLLLWADVVLPTLLPFMICSGMIVALNGVPLLTKPLIPFYGPVPAGKLCLYHGPSMRIPHGSTDGQPFPGRRTD